MRGKGITYDTGFLTAGGSTHEPFNPDLAQREMQIIRDDLQCNAVRITGGHVDRLEIAATHAAAAGLDVWWSPFTNDLTTDELLAVLADCAERAERLRQRGFAVVLLTGAELGLFTIGFLPGTTLNERLALLSAPQSLRALIEEVPTHINDFLGNTVAVVRARFGGKISYASLPFEGVDWTPFDFIATDAAYRSIEVADRYREGIRALVALGKVQGKPVAITEFGCTTHRGAANLGGRGDTIVAWSDDGKPVRLKGAYIRDEAEQATYLCELLDIFAEEGVDTAFVNTFARYDLPYRSDPREDFDMASFGVVKVLEGRHGQTYPDMPWEPKVAFTTLADYYRRSETEQSRG
jgi:hypothetical protein